MLGQLSASERVSGIGDDARLVRDSLGQAVVYFRLGNVHGNVSASSDAVVHRVARVVDEVIRVRTPTRMTSKIRETMVVRRSASGTLSRKNSRCGTSAQFHVLLSIVQNYNIGIDIVGGDNAKTYEFIFFY